MSVEKQKIEQMYDYLSAPSGPARGDGAFVFGRKDTRLVHTLSGLMVPEQPQVGYALITGGIGKDSGDLALPSVRVPEATYLGVHAEASGIPFDRLLLETQARNGGENARLGMEMIRVDERQLAHNSLVVIAHATSLRRLRATLEHEARVADFQVNRYSSVPTDYPFDPENPTDQLEAVREIKRIADWPSKGWLSEQPDLPVELAEYAAYIEHPLSADMQTRQ